MFFLFAVMIECFLQNQWFPLIYSFQLLYSSFLTGSFFVLYLHFYVSYLSVGSSKIIEHPYNQCFELCIWENMFLFCLFLSLELCSALSFGTFSFVSLPVFASVYQVELLHLPVLEEWCYVIDVLWILVAQSPWPPKPGAPSVLSCCSWALTAIGTSVGGTDP